MGPGYTCWGLRGTFCPTPALFCPDSVRSRDSAGTKVGRLCELFKIKSKTLTCQAVVFDPSGLKGVTGVLGLFHDGM